MINLSIADGRQELSSHIDGEKKREVEKSSVINFDCLDRWDDLHRKFRT